MFSLPFSTLLRTEEGHAAERAVESSKPKEDTSVFLPDVSERGEGVEGNLKEVEREEELEGNSQASGLHVNP